MSCPRCTCHTCAVVLPLKEGVERLDRDLQALRARHDADERPIRREVWEKSHISLPRAPYLEAQERLRLLENRHRAERLTIEMQIRALKDRQYEIESAALQPKEP